MHALAQQSFFKINCGAADTCFGLLVMSLLGFKARVGSLICTWWRPMCYMLSDIYLWCDTCWPLGDQYGCQTILFYIPVSKHWWGSKPGPIILPLTDQADADEFKLYFNRYTQYSVFQHVKSSCMLFCRIWKSEKVAVLIIYSPFGTESTQHSESYIKSLKFTFAIQNS